MNLSHDNLIMHPKGLNYSQRDLTYCSISDNFVCITGDQTITFFANDKIVDQLTPKYKDKEFSIRCMDSSLNGEKVVIAISSHILIYSFGNKWNEKKYITNKFKSSGIVNLIAWPLKHKIFFALLTGEITMLHIKTNTQTSIFSTQSLPITLSCHYRNRGISFSYYSGKVYSFDFQSLDREEGNKDFTNNYNQIKNIAEVSYKPYIILWACHNKYLVSGNTLSIDVYEEIQNGLDKSSPKVKSSQFNNSQSFNFANEDAGGGESVVEFEITCGCINNNGQLAAFGSYERIRLLSYNVDKKLWEYLSSVTLLLGSLAKDPQNAVIYAITSITWSRDSSKLLVGSCVGALATFSCYLKRLIYPLKGIGITYVTENAIILSKLGDDGKMSPDSSYNLQLSTKAAPEVQAIKFYDRDRLLVCQTKLSYILADLVTKEFGEVEKSQLIPLTPNLNNKESEGRRYSSKHGSLTIEAIKSCYATANILSKKKYSTRVSQYTCRM